MLNAFQESIGEVSGVSIFNARSFWNLIAEIVMDVTVMLDIRGELCKKWFGDLLLAYFHRIIKTMRAKYERFKTYQT